MPRVPGYLDDDPENVLGALWRAPSTEMPDELWPAHQLARIDPHPSGWLVVEEHFFRDDAHGGVGCVLVPQEMANAALAETTWTGRDLGKVAVWNDGTFDSGLLDEAGGVNAEFFVQARRASGRRLPHVEISYPFLWYWDAYEVADGWRYLNRAGREQDLLRVERSANDWKVEVRALEFRTFLAACHKSAVLQIDLVTKVEANDFERVDDEYVCDWAHFDFHALHDGLTGDRPAFSRLLGQYIVAGSRTSRLPRWEERAEESSYPEFVYGVDAETGAPLSHTCDPDELGSYYDQDGTRLHYLTPIYFKREVLQPYVAEPARYSVSASRLTCLDLWGVDISFNSVGLVEVYLGDLGRDLPSDEWGHWRTYNVPPEGEMEEGRFRRDFLNQIANSVDPVGDLRRARGEANDAALARFGFAIWRPIPPDLELEYQSLIGPLTDDPSALNGPLLVLTKVLVDAIDVRQLKTIVSRLEAGASSLKLLQSILIEIGDAEDSSKALRDLQALRSRGGIAHLSSSASRAAAADMGIEGLGAGEAFAVIVTRLTSALIQIARLCSAEVVD